MWPLNSIEQHPSARALFVLAALAVASCAELDGASPQAFGYLTPPKEFTRISVNNFASYTIDVTFRNNSYDQICIDEDIVHNENTFLIDVFLKFGSSFAKRRRVNLVPLTNENQIRLYPGNSIFIHLNLRTWYDEKVLEKFARSGSAIAIYIPISDCKGAVSYSSVVYTPNKS